MGRSHGHHKTLADAVVVIHFGFVLFVVAGAVAVFWKPWLAWLHIPTVLYGAAIEVVGGTCPLVPLENRLRRAGGQPEYHGSFLGHYLAGGIRPEQWERAEPWLGAAALLGNIVIYGYLVSSVRGG